jgi:predicted HD phosphohydrolase
MEIKSFKDLVKVAPKDLQQVFWQQWKAPQNINHHPEGNTLKHIAVVVTRAISQYPNNIDMILSAFFHDLGKYYTLDFKNNQPTAHGHEKISVEFVDKYADWIISLGGDPEKVKYVVSNHMKVKPHVWDVMKQSKKDKITQIMIC